MGAAHGADRQRERTDDFPARERGSTQVVVADGDEHRGIEILPREAGNGGAGRLGPAVDRGGGEQKMVFNSPVGFKGGVQAKPQCSACFINSVQDNMESIMNLTKTEGLLFKWGSGTGTNFSSLRGSRETLSGGGIASGPVSFMKGFDAFAGVIKSGGKTRRAAKMVILNAD